MLPLLALPWADPTEVRQKPKPPAFAAVARQEAKDRAMRRGVAKAVADIPREKKRAEVLAWEKARGRWKIAKLKHNMALAEGDRRKVEAARMALLALGTEPSAEAPYPEIYDDIMEEREERARQKNEEREMVEALEREMEMFAPLSGGPRLDQRPN